ncbi:MAG: carboxypeptidase regulatory-like domain-containing protein, partial [Planctomycetota bacterium]
LKDGVVRHRMPVTGGRAVFTGLAADVYDLQARGATTASDLERGVRTVHDGRQGADTLLIARPTFPVRVKTEPGATLWVGGVAYEPEDLRLPAGLHRLVVDHPRFVSSAERFVRVAGPTELTVTLEPGLSVTGQVVDRAAGQPVAGAEVEAFADGFATGRRTHAGADGSFALRGFRGSVVSLRVRAPGKATALRRLLFYPGAERARVNISLEAASTVTLATMSHITEQEGVELSKPVEAAEGVLLPGWYEEALEEPRLGANHTPRRDRGPRLSFPLTPGGRYRILVTAPGHRPASTEPFIAPPAGQTRELPGLTLRPAGALHGRVEVPGGAAAGRVVVCQGPEGVARCRTDRAGRFVFGNLDPGEHILWVRGVDETGTKVALEAGERLKRVDLTCRVELERVITGRVLDADDQALAGVEVEAAGHRATTGKDGAFRLTALPRGPQRFTLYFRPGPGCRALAKDPHLPHVERKVGVGTEARVRLLRAGRLWVRLDPGDRKLARARLLIASVATGVRLDRKLAYRAADAVVDDLPVGAHRVEVAAPGVLGTAGAVVHVTPAPEEPTTLTIAPGRTARGRVFLRRDDAQPGVGPAVQDLALDRGWVTLLDGDPLRALATVPVEADGTFVLQGLPAGPVVLLASAPGLPVAPVLVDLARGDADGVRIGLQQGAEAAVIVTGEQGEPVPRARVRVVSEHGIDIRDLAARGRFRGVVAGDEDLEAIGRFFRLRRSPGGRIAAPFVQPGSYRFLISADGYQPARMGVRARSAADVKRLREGFRRIKRDFPSGPPDLAAPVRLARETGGD